jgi:hypothetical protein
MASARNADEMGISGTRWHCSDRRTQYVLYWRAKFEETDALVKAHGPGILADADLADYRRMETFVGKTPDMLRLVLDVLNPRAFKDFVE